MANEWTLDIATIAGAFTDYGQPADFFYYKRLNALGLFGAVVPLEALTLPTRGQVVRFTWDKASTPRIHFEGWITDVREHTNIGMASIRGFDLLGLFWKASHARQVASGKNVRIFRDLTPYDILTQVGPPRGLIYDSQVNTIAALGTGATNAISAVNPGAAMYFEADSGNALINLQRLALQARYDAGALYGLEFWGALGGGGGTTPQLHVARRKVSGTPPAETWNIPDTLFQARRGTEGMTAAQAVRVIGAGPGHRRVESALIGTGGLEGIVADKTILRTTEATNMANRLSELLDPTKEVVTGVTFDHAHLSDLGDDITVTQTGKGNITPRLFDVAYMLRSRGFVVTLGRPRPVDQDPLFNLIGLSGGQAHGPQPVNHLPTDTTNPRVNANSNVADGASKSIALQFDANTYDAEYHEGLFLYLQATLDTAGTIDLEVQIPTGGTYALRMRMPSPGTTILDLPLYFPAAFLRDIIGVAGLITSANFTVTNRSGATVGIAAQIAGYING